MKILEKFTIRFAKSRVFDNESASLWFMNLVKSVNYLDAREFALATEMQPLLSSSTQCDKKSL